MFSKIATFLKKVWVKVVETVKKVYSKLGTSTKIGAAIGIATFLMVPTVHTWVLVSLLNLALITWVLIASVITIAAWVLLGYVIWDIVSQAL